MFCCKGLEGIYQQLLGTEQQQLTYLNNTSKLENSRLLQQKSQKGLTLVWKLGAVLRGTLQQCGSTGAKFCNASATTTIQRDNVYTVAHHDLILGEALASLLVRGPSLDARSWTWLELSFLFFSDQTGPHQT
eukprot:1159884-Pelagomonas_calceolata.AAC.2